MYTPVGPDHQKFPDMASFTQKNTKQTFLFLQFLQPTQYF